jgi:hypothetical protein
MKSILIFTLTMVVSLFSLSQDVISLNYTQSDVYTLFGENDYEEVINNGNLSEKRKVVEQKVINLTKMETNYYQDGVFVKTFKIDNCKEINGIFYITYKERDVRNNGTILTTQIVDTNKNTTYYCWYWDGDENTTFVVKESNLEMSVN